VNRRLHPPTLTLVRQFILRAVFDIGGLGIYSGFMETKQPKSANAAACGCEAHEPGRKAVAVDPEIKTANLKRLRRIEGQVRGLQKMVQEDRYCSDILTQVSSVQEALRGVSQALLRNHLRHCAAAALGSREASDRAAISDELVNLFAKFAR
jgi:DNA-binding FrmR family transcriptional regulator